MLMHFTSFYMSKSECVANQSWEDYQCIKHGESQSQICRLMVSLTGPKDVKVLMSNIKLKPQSSMERKEEKQIL